ncbi:MAG: N-acetylmuramoyl-L-alanine amidase domain-containing protein precursor [candidate division WS2 bacterium ADurb.Bin280]|uniref:N-acetylmuramoyl-L-alanine amidase domain-containing protein n=1 Tax=candidate division WS2 bacterium ADurb.Bin280 TaxID=1852829 RepID=A0A1V5SDH3_9BACT|nr:MAG: N-acetylmuramoyl-L-alanine amidase domain-containing protein precursor [candidate division WS2 bacterium ADurb.Bin280]
MKEGIVKRAVKVLSVLLITSFSFGQSQAASLDDLLNKRNSLNQEVEKYESAAESKAAEANSLSKQIGSLESDISSTQQKIEQTSTQIDEASKTIESLSGDIELKQKELESLKARLDDSIREIYKASNKSDYELILSGSNFSDIINQSKYIQSVENQVKSVYAQVKQAKKDMEQRKSDQEAKKAELDQLNNQQISYKKSAENQVSQKENLKSMTLQQQKEYEALVKKLQKEVSQVSAAIYAERQRRVSGGKETLTGGSGGYPYSCGNVDPWRFYTCQCTSYAAWYWNVVLGKSWTNTRPGSGDAKNWPTLARDQGYNVSSSPRVGAIISWLGSSITSSHGHVAIVEAVNSDGTIDISEYNWVKESYSYRHNVTPSDYGGHSYIY